MRYYPSRYLPSTAQTAAAASMWLAWLTVLLMQVSLQASLIVTLGPSFVITRFVLSTLLSGLRLTGFAVSR